MTRRPAPLPLLLGAIPALLLLGLLLFGVRGIAFAFIEYPIFAQPTVLMAGLAPAWADLALAFDWMGLDGFERPRFLSNLTQVGTVRLRWILHETGMAHASLGLQWLFVLAGVLFGALAGLLAFVGMSGDETTLLGVLLPALLVPGLLSRRAIGYWLAQIPFGLAFLAWALWGVPAAVAAADQPSFNMLSAMARYAGTNISRSATELSDLPAMVASNLLTFLAHAVSPLSDLAVAALEAPGAREPVLVMTLDPLYPVSPIHGNTTTLILLGAGPVLVLLASAAWLLGRRREAWALRCLLGLGLCAVVLAAMMRVPASGQFYYGTIAALPVALEPTLSEDGRRIERLAVGTWTDPSLRKTIRLAEAFEARFLANGLGRLRLSAVLREQGYALEDGTLSNGCHHLGTMRMGESASTSVCDREGRIHGLDNATVAGTALFPSYAWNAPTYTALALSRLQAERLAARLAQP